MTNQRNKAQAQLESIIEKSRKDSLKAQSHAKLIHTCLQYSNGELKRVQNISKDVKNKSNLVRQREKQFVKAIQNIQDGYDKHIAALNHQYTNGLEQNALDYAISKVKDFEQLLLIKTTEVSTNINSAW